MTDSITKTGSRCAYNVKDNLKEYVAVKVASVLKYVDAKLNKSGDDVTGNINMNQNRIVNV